ncbi:MAG: T9SS type A sorting domain-containing protein [Ignavibacteria bacterium]|nr:T9SS type A sorting domain-containing protein [Ignavibacteria bacterium]
MIYTEINSSNNSFDLYTSTFNREKLVFEQKRKLLDSFSSNAVFDSSLISWVSNDSLFVFNFRTNQYVNKYSLNGILIKAKIFLSYPYILLDQILLIMDVKNNSEPIDSFSLFQNYPNPFNPTTTIKYTVPNIGTRHASNLQLVTLKVYDMLGREVTTLVNDYKQPGTYNCEFRIENGKLPSGVYFYKLSAGYFTQTKKMLLLK